MVETKFRPQKKEFQMDVSLPEHYVGKEVHVLFFTKDEIEETRATISTSKKPSDFFGILNEDESKLFDAHIQRTRKEWDRNS